MSIRGLEMVRLRDSIPSSSSRGHMVSMDHGTRSEVLRGLTMRGPWEGRRASQHESDDAERLRSHSVAYRQGWESCDCKRRLPTEYFSWRQLTLTPGTSSSPAQSSVDADRILFFHRYRFRPRLPGPSEVSRKGVELPGTGGMSVAQLARREARDRRR
jgi:hypothetical protein